MFIIHIKSIIIIYQLFNSLVGKGDLFAEGNRTTILTHTDYSVIAVTVSPSPSFPLASFEAFLMINQMIEILSSQFFV